MFIVLTLLVMLSALLLIFQFTDVAFPGLGTILAVAAHAVAYGLIFESLGNVAR